jgi:hypothetical protein
MEAFTIRSGFDSKCLLGKQISIQISSSKPQRNYIIQIQFIFQMKLKITVHYQLWKTDLCSAHFKNITLKTIYPHKNTYQSKLQC